MLKELLFKYWGYSSFRPLQKEIINSVLEGEDTFALLPTGGGKSLCFQIPAMLKEGVCIVISPLIALIEDQVNTLQDKGIKAIQIKSGSTENEIITLFDNIRFGDYKFLYISPERLQSKFIQDKIAQLNVSIVAIDEAHCISEWGQDFRPSYRYILVLRVIHPEVAFIALTATATTKVVKDIIKNLELKAPKIYKKSFYRENLSYTVLRTDDKLNKLKRLLTKLKEPTIIYVNSRRKTQDLSNYLNKNQIATSFYHGGMAIEEKQKSFDTWFSEKTPIMVATNAFGMGIDKPNVRLVVHYDLPFSIENYVQEAGRAGRDGNKSYSLILTNKTDIKYLEDTHKKNSPTLEDIKEVHRKLYQYFQIGKGELCVEELQINLYEFSEKYGFSSVITYHVLQILSNFGVIEFNPNSRMKSRIQFLINSNRLIQFVETNIQLKNFIQTILRFYTGVFEKEVTIDEFYIAKKVGITSKQVFDYLEFLEQQQIIKYFKNTNNPSLFFLHPREDDRTINRYSREIKTYLNQKGLKIKDLVDFVNNSFVCRSVQILDYFDEQSDKKCGNCEVCRNSNKPINIEEELITVLKSSKSFTLNDIIKKFNYPDKEIISALRFLISEDRVGVDNDKYYIIK